jgi:hypothetical protein
LSAQLDILILDEGVNLFILHVVSAVGAMTHAEIDKVIVAASISIDAVITDHFLLSAERAIEIQFHHSSLPSTSCLYNLRIKRIVAHQVAAASITTPIILVSPFVFYKYNTINIRKKQDGIITKQLHEKLVKLYNTPNTLRCRLEQSTAKRPGFFCAK